MISMEIKNQSSVYPQCELQYFRWRYRNPSTGTHHVARAVRREIQRAVLDVVILSSITAVFDSQFLFTQRLLEREGDEQPGRNAGNALIVRVQLNKLVIVVDPAAPMLQGPHETVHRMLCAFSFVVHSGRRWQILTCHKKKKLMSGDNGGCRSKNRDFEDRKKVGNIGVFTKILTPSFTKLDAQQKKKVKPWDAFEKIAIKPEFRIVKS